MEHGSPDPTKFSPEKEHHAVDARDMFSLSTNRTCVILLQSRITTVNVAMAFTMTLRRIFTCRKPVIRMADISVITSHNECQERNEPER